MCCQFVHCWGISGGMVTGGRTAHDARHLKKDDHNLNVPLARNKFGGVGGFTPSQSNFQPEVI